MEHKETPKTLHSRARRSTRTSSTNAPGYNSGTSYHSGYRTHAGEAEARQLQSAAPNATGTPQPLIRNNPPPLNAKPGSTFIHPILTLFSLMNIPFVANTRANII